MRSGVVVLLAVGLATAATALGNTGVPPPGLSAKGRVLWKFEALLHDTFGSHSICTTGNSNFISDGCAPLATHSPYIYVFSGARRSAFHLVSRRPRGSFGNYPVLVRIACGPRERTFLIEYSDSVNFALDCLPPLR